MRLCLDGAAPSCVSLQFAHPLVCRPEHQEEPRVPLLTFAHLNTPQNNIKNIKTTTKSTNNKNEQ